MAMQALFRCGCTARLTDAQTGGDAPRCAVHHAHIARVLMVRPPSFTGCCSGPYATTKALDPASPLLAESRLTLRPPTTGDPDAARG